MGSSRGLRVGGGRAYRLNAAQGTFSLTGESAALAHSGASSFFADPFSAYTSYIADQTFSGTNGTVGTRSWNGSTITAPIYGPDSNGLPQPAINAAAAVNGGAGQRVCLLAGQTWTNLTLTVALKIPSLSGTSDSSRFAIQGDPAASATTMPIISGGGNPGGAFTIGAGNADATYGPNYGWSAANPYVTIRKLEITNYVGSATGQQLGFGILLGSNNYNGFVVEYSKIHMLRFYQGGTGANGPVFTTSPGDTATFAVRYNKLYDMVSIGGQATVPFAAIETYGGVFDIHHNEVYEMPTFFAGKVLTPVTPNGSIHQNLVHDVVDMIEFEAGGENTGINGIAIYGNLFYWKSLNDSVFGPASGASVWNDFGSTGNTTYPTGVQFYNNTIDANIGGAGALMFWNQDTSNVQWYNNIALGGYPIAVRANSTAASFTFCDYNFYFNPQIFYLNESGSPASVVSFSAWQSAHTSYPSFTGLTANPDVHGADIHAMSAPWNTAAANFPNSASYDYTIATGSPLKGAGQGGVDPGYTPTDCGPGW
jgi:hypothetical protein